MKTVKVNRVDNMTANKRDSIIRNDATVNLTGEKTRAERRFNRYKSTSDYKMKQKIHIFCSIVLLFFIVLLWFRVNAEEVTLETIIEKEEITDSDIDKFIEIIENTYIEEEIDTSIFPTEESWKNYEEFMREWERLHQLKYEEQKKKSSVIEEAFNFIIKYEWYSDKPYWDRKQYSCWYGMRCSKNTTWITKEKSKKFVLERIENIRKKYNLEKYNDNIEIALISFVYNIWHLPEWTEWYIENWYINWLKNRMKQYIYAWNVKLGGLVKRRNAETNLF